MPTWFNIFDYIEAFFWTVTYIIIIATAFINKNECRFPMASITVFINFSWETASVIYSYFNGGLGFTRANFIRFSWFFFDIFILFLLIYKFNKNNNKNKRFYYYLFFCFLLTILFAYCFQHLKYGMVISSFIIDAHMEIMFWKNRKSFDPSNRLLIGVIKILGDFFAGIYCCTFHYIVGVLATTALAFDVLYIIFAVKEKKSHPEISENFSKNLSTFIANLKQIQLNRHLFSIKFSKQKTNKKHRTYKKKRKNKKTHRTNKRKRVK